MKVVLWRHLLYLPKRCMWFSYGAERSWTRVNSFSGFSILFSRNTKS